MRTHFKEKSKRGRIDLTMVGRYEMIEPAIATKDQWLAEKYPEARIVEKLEDLFIPLPTFTAEEKIELWKRINLIKFIKSLAP